ncbi:hypothetical protein WDW86_03045 [Bdellovibrionota bacterium FG-2]
MNSEFTGPVNIGSEWMVSVFEPRGFAEMIMKIAEKKVTLKNVPGPTGVRGRTSKSAPKSAPKSAMIRKKLGWAPLMPLN